jgi:hypothetical protein
MISMPCAQAIDDRSSTRVGRWPLVTTLLRVVFPDGRPTGRLRLLAWLDGIAVRGSGR